MKKSIFALVGAAFMLASGFMFTGCSSDDDDDSDATMTVKLAFSDFTATSVSVKYGNGQNKDDPTKTSTITANLASDGKSATFTASDKYVNDGGYMDIITLTVSNSDGEVETTFDSNSSGETGAWFKFVEDGSVTITYKKKAAETATTIDSKEYTATSADAVQVFAADKFSSLTISKLKIQFANVSAGGDNNWYAGVDCVADFADNSTAVWSGNDHWSDDISGYLFVITDTTFITGVKTNGLYVKTGADLTCTLSVLYE